MPAISVWGPPTWTMLHILAEKINEADYPRLSAQLFALIKRICAVLPCPECSQHSTTFLNKIKPSNISTKRDLINMLYIFHNMVNVKKKKPLFNYENMAKYKQITIQHAYRNFISVYNTRGNMKMLAETFQRQIVVRDLRTWINTHRLSFS
jgi:hypothetical protein